MSDEIYVKRNGVTNHWGIWVDPNLPITGVVSNNDVVQFISDEMYNGIDLDWEDHINSPNHLEQEKENEYCGECENWEMQQSTILIGNWIKDSDGLYEYDPDGEYAAIVGEIYTQVVFSQHARRSNLCSPCYPGQGDIGSDGDYLTYDLPPEAYEIY